MQNAPRQGIGYGILRYLNQDSSIAEQLALGAEAEVCFNYLGQFDSIIKEKGFFSPIAGATGAHQNHNEKRNWALEVRCLIYEGRLRCNWVYSRNLHQSSTIEHLAWAYTEALRHLITPESSDLDIDALGFDTLELDSILEKL